MAYLDGELAPGRAAEAMTHLDRCPDEPVLLAPAMENPKPSRHPLWKVLPV